tara:strand:- start:2019 stop:3608 length:1590 start_codon:yes stop_codon:yes gene_type:complete
MIHVSNTRALNWIGIGTIIIGIVVALGWVFDIQLLKTILPGYVSMKLNTALGFILSGTIVLVFLQKKLRTIGILLSGILTVLGLASLSQDIFAFDLGIDQLFITDTNALNTGVSAPGRPSPTTALCFALFGMVFLAIRSSDMRIKRGLQYALHTITLIAFVAIVGYLFNVPPSDKLSFFTSMAIHTSVSLFVLSIGVSFIHPTIGLTELFVGKKIGSVMTRFLFRNILVAVLLLGLIQLKLHDLNIITTHFGIALFSVSFLLVALYTMWSTAQRLNITDKKRSEAEEKLISTNKNLETIVEERTRYLTRQNKQLEDFAYIVSHNLRGPTSNLKTLMDFYNGEETMEEKDFIMEKFETTVNNLDTTLNHLLDVVSIRHESKKAKESLDFESVLSKIIDTYQGKIMASNAKITSNFSKAPILEYSSIYLESIMQNLLSNALKYRSLERNPVIHFETSSLSDNVCLLVSDNGLGIDIEANKSRLFGLHKTFHKHPEAKGVGLFITKAQVEAMGGNIDVESVVNRGTTFKINF